MIGEKRTRGRPPGSGKNDSASLKKVAELLARDPSLRPTTAMRRATGTTDPSVIRRLQVKWKAEHLTYEAEARARRKDPDEAANAFTHLDSVLNDHLELATQAAALVGRNAPLQLLANLHDRPVMRYLRELQDNTAFGILSSLGDSPTSRFMRQLEESARLLAPLQTVFGRPHRRNGD